MKRASCRPPRGIFSPDGIDKGTAVLLAEAPAPSPQGNLLDIGCGWGPIALTLALRAPHAHVYAVDVNERCVDPDQRKRRRCWGWATSRPACRTTSIPTSASTPSGPTRPSGSARTNFTPCCCCGCPGWRRADRPGWWSRRTLVRIRCSAGWRAELDSSFTRDPGEHLEVVPDPSGQESVPLATITAGPLSSTCSWPSGAEEELHADDAARAPGRSRRPERPARPSDGWRRRPRRRRCRRTASPPRRARGRAW